MINYYIALIEFYNLKKSKYQIKGKYLEDCTLYVTLEPCQMCAGALYWSQVKHIVYAASDEKRGYLTLGTKLHPKTKVEYGLLEEESKALLQEFFRKRR